MEFTQGQVFGMEKIEKIFKKTKEQKQSELTLQQEQSLIDGARTEISSLRENLDQLTDTEAIEASIYRLKAAELELNRHIKSLKRSSFKS